MPQQTPKKKQQPKRDTTQYATVQGKQVPKRKIDSALKANPGFKRAIGKVGKGSGGMDNYRNEQADWVNKVLKKKGK